MKMRVLAACLLAMASGGAVAQSEADTKEVQNELAYQKAVNDLLMARYPDFDGGKSGNIQNAEKLAGMAALLMPQAVMAIGSSVAHDFSGCGAGTVILSGSGLSERLLVAESQRIELAELERELDIKPEAGGVRFSAGTAILGLGALVSYAGIFKSDYTVNSGTANVDQGWLVASMVLVNSKNSSDRFPDRAKIQEYQKRLQAVGLAVDGLDDKDKKKARYNALRAALYKAGADGVLPLSTLAMLPALSEGKCVALVSETTAAPLLLTKETIFGKGGKAYFYLPVMASVIQLDPQGKLQRLICKSAVASTPIKLSDLIKSDAGSTPHWQNAAVVSGDCGSLQSSPPQPGAATDPPGQGTKINIQTVEDLDVEVPDEKQP